MKKSEGTALLLLKAVCEFIKIDVSMVYVYTALCKLHFNNRKTGHIVGNVYDLQKKHSTETTWRS